MIITTIYDDFKNPIGEIGVQPDGDFYCYVYADSTTAYGFKAEHLAEDYILNKTFDLK